MLESSSDDYYSVNSVCVNECITGFMYYPDHIEKLSNNNIMQSYNFGYALKLKGIVEKHNYNLEDVKRNLKNDLLVRDDFFLFCKDFLTNTFNSLNAIDPDIKSDFFLFLYDSFEEMNKKDESVSEEMKKICYQKIEITIRSLVSF